MAGECRGSRDCDVVTVVLISVSRYFLVRSHTREKRSLASCFFVRPSVRLSACISASPTRQIYVKFVISDLYENLPGKI